MRADTFEAKGIEQVMLPVPLMLGQTVLEQALTWLTTQGLAVNKKSVRISVRLCDGDDQVAEMNRTDYLLFDGTHYLLCTSRDDDRYHQRYVVKPELMVYFDSSA